MRTTTAATRPAAAVWTTAQLAPATTVRLPGPQTFATPNRLAHRGLCRISPSCHLRGNLIPLMDRLTTAGSNIPRPSRILTSSSTDHHRGQSLTEARQEVGLRFVPKLFAKQKTKVSGLIIPSNPPTAINTPSVTRKRAFTLIRLHKSARLLSAQRPESFVQWPFIVI